MPEPEEVRMFLVGLFAFATGLATMIGGTLNGYPWLTVAGVLWAWAGFVVLLAVG